jgi:hypothetical protein
MSDSLWVIIPTGQRRSGEWIDDTLKQRVAESGMFSRTPLVADFPRQRVEVVRGADAVVGELFRRRGWTDGLPIVPPTVGRIEAMLRFTDRGRNDVVGELDPLRGAATVEKIAANAVMAGCRPDYLPVVLAAVEALIEPDFNLRGVQTTDENVTPLVIVNGPVARDLDINASFGALGPGWQANAAIGRAIRLIMNNIGGGWPGVVSFAGLGQPGRYSLCLAEDEDRNPWEPLHVEAGFAPEISTVTLMRAESVVNVTGGLAEIASAMGSAASNFGRLHDGNVAVILAPAVAKELADEGWDKAAVKRHLADHAVMPAEVWRACWVARNIAGTTRLPDWVTAAEQAGDGIPAVGDPTRITLVVAGGDIPIAQHAYFPSWGFPACRVTKAIRLPPDWDELRETSVV